MLPEPIERGIKKYVDSFHAIETLNNNSILTDEEMLNFEHRLLFDIIDDIAKYLGKG